MHAWHDVPWGSDLREYFHAIIEIPEGSKVKYELDKPTGLLMADRVLYSAVHYPANYGFIPQSYCADGAERVIRHALELYAERRSELRKG